MRDIYDPPPAPEIYESPAPERIRWTRADVLWLACVCAILLLGAAWAWLIEPALGVGISIAGLVVILESWFSALTFLHRHPQDRPLGRGVIFLAALVPWLIGIGGAAALMIGLFWASDRSQ
jgi:hypothetical protein